MLKAKEGNEGVYTNKNCCKDEHKEVKTDKDQKLVSAEFEFSKLLHEAFSVPNSVLRENFNVSILLENPATHGPPLNHVSPLFLLNRNFRI
jgi:hypothetical protein